MAGQRMPIDLLEARNKKHLTKDEKKQRRATEVKAPNDAIVPPSCLTRKEKVKFIDLAGQMNEIGIMANLDCDGLARYLQSETKYLAYDKMVNKYMASISKAEKDSGVVEISLVTLTQMEALRDKAFKQCRSSAADMGLTISSRCKLVVPKKEEDKPVSKMAEFMANRASR